MTAPRPTIPALLEQAVHDFGDRDYLVTPTGRITYQEAERDSARAARWLLSRGVGKGTRVGSFFPNGPDWVVWWLAASRIGALVVPLSTLYTPAEIAKVLRLADIGMLVAPSSVLGIDVAERLESALPGLAGHRDGRLALSGAPYLRSVVMIGDELPELVRGYQKVPPSLRRQPMNGGPSPDKQLVEGLGTIGEEIARMNARLADNDLKALATQNRFLEIKYKGDGEMGE